MIVLRELAPAKVNLYLHVLGRRTDGYHLLDSLVCFADTADKLEVAPAESLILTFSGPYASQLAMEGNSVLKAAAALKSHAGIKAGASLTLHKHLPVAAGIGGGSADAAAALRLLMRFWKLSIPHGELMAIALGLGADVPACFHAASLYMGGIGEHIIKGPVMDGLYAVLVNPGKPLATSQVFARFKIPFSSPARHPEAFATPDACVEFLRKQRNDLEAPARELMPAIGTVLEVLGGQAGCLLTRMSGSGATCFGLFTDKALAEKAALAIGAHDATWWVSSGTLH